VCWCCGIPSLSGFRSTRLRQASSVIELYVVVRCEVQFRGTHRVLHLGPGYDSFVISKCSRTAHYPGARDLIQSLDCSFYLRMSITQASRASC